MRKGRDGGEKTEEENGGKNWKKGGKCQPSGEGGARSPPATPHHLQNPKWPPGGPKMADWVCLDCPNAARLCQ